MAEATDAQDAVPPSAALHPRSCVVCRQRKVKCDRQQPCSNCNRSKCACVYPTGRGRAPKRARRVADALLADKLARLETIVQRMAAENGPGPGVARRQSQLQSNDGSGQAVLATESGCGINPESLTGRESRGLAEQTNSSHSSPADGDQASIEASLSRLVIDDKKSYYVSNPLWASMAQEVNSTGFSTHCPVWTAAGIIIIIDRRMISDRGTTRYPGRVRV